MCSLKSPEPGHKDRTQHIRRSVSSRIILDCAFGRQGRVYSGVQQGFEGFVRLASASVHSSSCGGSRLIMASTFIRVGTIQI